MPRRAKGPRLYLDKKRGQWVIRDRSCFIRTGAGAGNRSFAEKALAQYIIHKYQPKPSGSPMIAEVLAIYGDEVAAHKKTARNIGYNISNLLKWWGDKTVADISVRTCRDYASHRPPMAAHSDLKVLRAATKYWHRSEYGPLERVPPFWQPQGNPPRDKWLTRQEAARLVRASKTYPYLCRFILLGLHTGSRPGVILSLMWEQVDCTHGVLRRSKGAQDSKKKAPPVRLGRQILWFLRRWKAKDGPDAKYVCGGFDDPHTSWARVVKAAGLEGITRHTLRHTRATWLMQAGVDPWEAAGHLGMTVKTLTEIYAKHHPSFQEKAANV